jgi:hypothetical protein
MEPTVEFIENYLPKMVERYNSSDRERVKEDLKAFQKRKEQNSTLHRESVIKYARGLLSSDELQIIKEETDKENEKNAAAEKSLQAAEIALSELARQNDPSLFRIAEEWKKADFEHKRMWQWAVFESGLAYSQEFGFFTPQNPQLAQDLMDFMLSQNFGVPDGIRTRVTAVKGRCPRPG